MNTPRTDSLDRYLQTLIPSERYTPMRLHAERLEKELSTLLLKTATLLAEIDLGDNAPEFIRKAASKFYLNS